MNTCLNSVVRQFNQIVPAVDFWTLRLTSETSESVNVRQGVMQPVYNHQATGALITVVIGDGSGYAATSDLSTEGLKRAADIACEWARQSARSGLLKAADYPRPDAVAK
jgi:predicted Zn-dependent protease